MEPYELRRFLPLIIWRIQCLADTMTKAASKTTIAAHREFLHGMSNTTRFWHFLVSITLNASRVPRLNGQSLRPEQARRFTRGRSLGTSRVTRGTNERALILWIKGPPLSLNVIEINFCLWFNHQRRILIPTRGALVIAEQI